MPITINGTGPIDGITSLNTSVSSTELGFLDGVSSGIQNQINSNIPGMQLISSNSTSATVGISFDNVFTSTYQNYFITWTGVANTAEANLTMRLRSNGSDNSSSTYGYFQFAQGVNNTSYNQASAGDTSFTIGRIGSAGTSSLSMYVFQPQIAARTTIHTQNIACGTTTVFVQTGGGAFIGTTQFDGFTINVAANNQTSTVRVYGLRN